MAATDSAAPRSAGASVSDKPYQKKPRVGLRLDMTPMVDVAFLLLTFFMLTTVFSRPQALEINLPKTDAPVPIAESDLLTVRVRADGTPTWAAGTGAATAVSWPGLHDRLVEAARANPGLVAVLKVDRDGPYTAAVDALDEFQLAGVTRFSIAPMTPADETLADAAGPAPRS